MEFRQSILPLASAGSLFGMALASQLAAMHGNILVIASEKMSAIASRHPLERGVAPLFGDGAGACLIGTGRSPGEDYRFDRCIQTARFPKTCGWNLTHRSK